MYGRPLSQSRVDQNKKKTYLQSQIASHKQRLEALTIKYNENDMALKAIQKRIQNPNHSETLHDQPMSSYTFLSSANSFLSIPNDELVQHIEHDQKMIGRNSNILKREIEEFERDLRAMN